MPSKFITSTAWTEIERMTIKCVKELDIVIKDTEMLNYVVVKGLKELTVADVRAVKLLHESQQEMSLALETAEQTLQSVTAKHTKTSN